MWSSCHSRLPTSPAPKSGRPWCWAALTRGDLILCQITSQAAGHPEAVPILLGDFEAGGGLLRASFALPHRVVTANEVCVRRAVGRLKPDKLNHIRERVCAIIRQS